VGRGGGGEGGEQKRYDGWGEDTHDGGVKLRPMRITGAKGRVEGG